MLQLHFNLNSEVAARTERGSPEPQRIGLIEPIQTFTACSSLPRAAALESRAPRPVLISEFVFRMVLPALMCLVWVAGAAAAAPTNLPIWTVTTGDPGDPILSSPAVASDGTIYVGSYDRHLYAVTPAGSNKWAFPLPTSGFAGIYSSPAIGRDGTIYFGADDGNLYAVNAANGSSKWTFAAGDAVYSDPAIGPDGTIYIGSYSTPRSYLYAINTNGTQRWRYQPPDGIFSDPVVAVDGTIYFGCDDQKLYALNTNGTFRWSFATGGAVTASPAIGADGAVYIGTTTSKKFYAVNPDGSKRWEYLTGGGINSSAALDVDGTVYFGSDGGGLYALNANGTLKWRFAAGGPVRSSPAIAADGTIYFGCEDGRLYAIDRTGSNLWTLVTGDNVFSSPVIAPDGTVYVGSADHKLYAVAGVSGPASTSWPMFRRNLRHTGRQYLPPMIQSIQPVTNGMALTWTSQRGQGYRIHYKSNLQDIGWFDLPGEVQATGLSAGATDASATNGYRFYRVSAVP